MVNIVQEPSHAELNGLVRFVLARLDDDYADLKRAVRVGRFNGWDEERRRVEIESRREIVGVVQRMAVLRDLPSEVHVRTHAAQMMRALADVWKDHPSYSPAWRELARLQISLPAAGADGRPAGDLLDPV